MGDNSRTDEHGISRFIELAERGQRRRRFSDWFNRRQRLISFERRRWLSIAEMADEYAREPGSLEVNAERRDRFIDSVRRSILSGEFVHNGRSKVLNVSPSGHAENRFDPLGATNEELFNPIAGYLWMSRTQWFEWLGRHGVAIPRFLAAREAPSLPAAEDNSHVEQPSLREPPRLIQLPKEEPKGAQSSAAWKAMNALWPEGGVPENEKTSDVYRAVNKWIKKQPRSLVEVDAVSREVVERLLGRRK
jgi:hypothetical protein